MKRVVRWAGAVLGFLAFLMLVTIGQHAADYARELFAGDEYQNYLYWHGLNAARVWSLWTRYACTAFYSHPHVWNEIGFPGPAYPRGYKNAGVGKLEPFEVRDARPAEDPVGDDA